MKAITKIAGPDKRLRTSLLRRLENFITHPAFANYTPTGPGALATGQAGAIYRATVNGRPGVTGGSRQTASQPLAGSYDQSSEPCQGYA